MHANERLQTTVVQMIGSKSINWHASDEVLGQIPIPCFFCDTKIWCCVSLHWWPWESNQCHASSQLSPSWVVYNRISGLRLKISNFASHKGSNKICFFRLGTEIPKYRNYVLSLNIVSLVNSSELTPYKTQKQQTVKSTDAGSCGWDQFQLDSTFKGRKGEQTCINPILIQMRGWPFSRHRL